MHVAYVLTGERRSYRCDYIMGPSDVATTCLLCESDEALCIQRNYRSFCSCATFDHQAHHKNNSSDTTGAPQPDPVFTSPTLFPSHILFYTTNLQEEPYPLYKLNAKSKKDIRANQLHTRNILLQVAHNASQT